MTGYQSSGQSQLFYSFNLEDYVPQSHLPRSIDTVNNWGLQWTGRTAAVVKNAVNPNKYKVYGQLWRMTGMKQ